MKIRIFSKNNELSESVRNELEEKLVSNGYELSNKDDFDLAISVGGDGTFIKMIHECNFNSDKKYASINTGNLGYMSTVDKDEINSFIEDLKTNSFIKEESKFLTIKITTNDEYNGTILKALNEITIRSTLLKTLYLSTFVNSNLLYNLSGDGVNICTSFGSTAYNMSLGGSIIDSSLGAIEVVPIAPINSVAHRNIASPFITSDKNKIIIKPINKENSISIIIDGKIIPIKDLISVEVTVNDSIRILKNVDHNDIITMNNKIYK